MFVAGSKVQHQYVSSVYNVATITDTLKPFLVDSLRHVVVLLESTTVFIMNVVPTKHFLVIFLVLDYHEQMSALTSP